MTRPHPPRTFPWKTAALAALCALAVAGCATTERLVAAGDVHAFLIAIRDGDQTGFDAHVDRPALERQIESEVLAHTGGSDSGDALRGLGALLARPLAKFAGEALVQPRVFLTVAEYYGYTPDKPIPGQFAIAAALKSLPDGRVCATRAHGGPCLLTFADEDGSWRLVSFNGDASMLRIGR